MSWELLQHVSVTLVAVGAAGVLLRQVAAFLWPTKEGAVCANCVSSTKPTARSLSRPAAGAGKTVMTVQVIRGRSTHK